MPKIPTVKFIAAPLDMEADLLCVFSKPGERFGNVMNRVFPDLPEALKDANTWEEAVSRCRVYAKKITERDAQLVSDSVEKIEKDWKPISEKYLTLLSKLFETDWPEDKRVIMGYVSILPICPRFLESFSFSVNYKMGQMQVREIIAHEIQHFLWFKKWKEIFPESKKEEFESPHLAWRVSEIMDPIILQCTPEIKEMIQPTRWGYDSFKTIKIGEIGMTEHFRQLYGGCLRNGDSIEMIMKKAWEEAKKYKEEIGKF